MSKEKEAPNSVQSRLQRFYARYPRGSVTGSEVVFENARVTVIRAQVARWPGDPAPAAAHAMQPRGYYKSLEECESRALGRALANLYVDDTIAAVPTAEELAAADELWDRHQRVAALKNLPAEEHLVAAISNFLPELKKDEERNHKLIARLEASIAFGMTTEQAVLSLRHLRDRKGLKVDEAELGIPVELFDFRQDAAPAAYTSNGFRNFDAESYRDPIERRRTLFGLWPLSTIRPEFKGVDENGDVTIQAWLYRFPSDVSPVSALARLRPNGAHRSYLTSWVETCETVSVGRVLEYAGIYKDRSTPVREPCASDLVLEKLRTAILDIDRNRLDVPIEDVEMALMRGLSVAEADRAMDYIEKMKQVPALRFSLPTPSLDHLSVVA